MIVSIGVSTSKYKMVQNQQTKVCTFYVLGEVAKTIEQAEFLSSETLFELLISEATQYQQSQEES